MTKKTKLLFESVTCSRCGGSGQYSYCSLYGRTCFKCHGNGVVLSKRGHAAQLFLDQLRTKDAREISEGDVCLVSVVTFSSIADVWLVATHDAVVDLDGKALVTFAYKSGKTENYGFGRGCTVKAKGSKEIEDGRRAQALAYQETLTKSGTVARVGRREKARAQKSDQVLEVLV